jgi:hypothetical protein
VCWIPWALLVSESILPLLLLLLLLLVMPCIAQVMIRRPFRIEADGWPNQAGQEILVKMGQTLTLTTRGACVDTGSVWRGAGELVGVEGGCSGATRGSGRVASGVNRCEEGPQIHSLEWFWLVLGEPCQGGRDPHTHNQGYVQNAQTLSCSHSLALL